MGCDCSGQVVCEKHSNDTQDLRVSSSLWYSLRRSVTDAHMDLVRQDTLTAMPLAHRHPEYEIACLVRNSDKGAQVASQYTNARLVYGILDDKDIPGQEAKKADIVLNTSVL